MQNAFTKVVLGLSIIAGSVATAAPAGAFTLHNYATGYCLAVSAGNQSEGAHLIVWPCSSNNSDPSQQFGFNSRFGTFVPAPSGANAQYHTNVTQAHDWVLGVWDGTHQWYDGQPIIDWASTTDANQLWTASWAVNDSAGTACYYIENAGHTPGGDPREPHKVLAVSGGSRSQGAAVVIYSLFTDSQSGRPDYQGHPDQYWCVYNN
jgi:hypothetical protein